jgi:hypothetical protein
MTIAKQVIILEFQAMFHGNLGDDQEHGTQNKPFQARRKLIMWTPNRILYNGNENPYVKQLQD